MSSKTFYQLISIIAGLLIFSIGLLNLFRGNDTLLGVVFIILSFIYIPSANTLIRKVFGFTIHNAIKVILAILLLYVSMAVGAIAEGYYPEII